MARDSHTEGYAIGRSVIGGDVVEGNPPVVIPADDLFRYLDEDIVAELAAILGSEGLEALDSDSVTSVAVVVTADTQQTLDAAVVGMVAVPSDDEEVEHTTSDAATVTSLTALSAVEQKTSSDAATVTEASVVSATSLHGYADPATVVESSSTSAVEGHTSFDAATVVSNTIIVSIDSKVTVKDKKASTDAFRVINVSVVSAAEHVGRADSSAVTELSTVPSVDHAQYVDADTPTSVAVVSSTFGYADADTITGIEIPSAVFGYDDAAVVTSVESVVAEITPTFDAATPTAVAVISAVETEQTIDTGVVVIGVEVSSAIDVDVTVDAGTITSTSVISAIEGDQSVDAATMIEVGVPSAVETIQAVDAAIPTNISVVSSSEIYTSPDYSLLDSGSVTGSAVSNGFVTTLPISITTANGSLAPTNGHAQFFYLAVEGPCGYNTGSGAYNIVETNHTGGGPGTLAATSNNNIFGPAYGPLFYAIVIRAYQCTAGAPNPDTYTWNIVAGDHTSPIPAGTYRWVIQQFRVDIPIDTTAGCLDPGGTAGNLLFARSPNSGTGAFTNNFNVFGPTIADKELYVALRIGLSTTLNPLTSLNGFGSQFNWAGATDLGGVTTGIFGGGSVALTSQVWVDLSAHHTAEIPGMGATTAEHWGSSGTPLDAQAVFLQPFFRT